MALSCAWMKGRSSIQPTRLRVGAGGGLYEDQGAAADTRKLLGYNLWYRSGSGHGCSSATGQRFPVQLSAQPFGGGVRMQDWHSLFTGNAASARDLASELEAHGLRSFVDDRQGPIVTPGGSTANYSVVLVPPEEAERAQEFARQWQAQNKEDTRLLTGRLAKVLVASFVAPAVWLVAYVLLPEALPSPTPGRLLGALLVSFIVFAQLENRRHVREAPYDAAAS